MPWDDVEVVDTTGQYLGSIFPENRFYRVHANPYRGYPGYPGYPEYPGYTGYPGYPGYAGYSPLPFGASEVQIKKERGKTAIAEQG